ncbi:MAG: hypothetical protein AB7G62_20775 [Magnetospirillum sp.]
MSTATVSSFRSEITAVAMGLVILCAGTVAVIGSIGLGAWILGV